VVVFWILFPIAYVIWKKPNIYDGVRHFLFVLPALSLCAGVAAAWAVDFIDRKKAGWGLPVVAVIFLTVLPAIFITHPYQYTFYNIFAGPRETVHTRYETDYWLTSYREAANQLNKIQEQEGRPLKVLVGANALSLPTIGEFVTGTMQLGSVIGQRPEKFLPGEIDYYVAVTRYGMSENFPESPIVSEIRSGGALMSLIRKSKPPQKPSVNPVAPATSSPAEP
jgi:hypothetical protein